MQNQTSPLILTFGVSDPVGATGIQADLAVFAALGCHGLSVLTGLLIADTARVEDIDEVDADWVADQARVLLEDMPVAAFKVGALTSIEQASAIAEIVSDYPDVPLILDPFLSSLPDSGLADDDMLSAIRQILVPQASVLLLSQVELARMAETWREGGADMLAQDVAELTGMGCAMVLVTGTGTAGKGQAKGDAATISNTLYDESGLLEPAAAVRAAQVYTHGALANAQRFGMGKLVPNKFFRAAGPGALQAKP